MSGGGKGQSQTTKQKNDPWAGAVPYLLDAMSNLQNTYSNGGQFMPFAGYAPASPYTQEGWDMRQNIADQSQDFINQMGGAFGQWMNSATPGQNPFINMLMDPATGQWNWNNSDARAMFQPFAAGQEAWAGAPGFAGLGQVGSGAFLGANPHLDANFNRMAEQVRNQVNSQFSAAGRYGSGAHQDVTTQGLNDLAMQVYGQNYETERGRMDAANNAMAGGYNSALGRQMQAMGMFGQNYEAERQRQMQAIQAMQQMQGQDFQNMGQALAWAPNFLQMMYSPAAAYGQIGSDMERYEQQQIADLMARWQYGQTADWEAVQNYFAPILSAGGLGGTSKATTTTSSNPMQSILGGISTIAGMMTGNPMAAMGGMQALGGASSAASSAGALASMLSHSSLKDVHGDYGGILDRIAGIPVKAWSYKGDGQVFVGPMAEDFQRAAGVGDGVTIHGINAIGVLLQAIKELNAKIERLEGART